MTGQSLVASPDERPGHKQKLMEEGRAKRPFFSSFKTQNEKGGNPKPVLSTKTHFHYFFSLVLDSFPC